MKVEKSGRGFIVNYGMCKKTAKVEAPGELLVVDYFWW